jgi:hypothetical protein
MNWELIIANYGYFALLAGTFLEGETILMIAARLKILFFILPEMVL